MMKPIYEGALLDGWMELPLRDAIFLKRGYSWSKDQEASDPQPGTTPVIRIPNIQSRLDLSDLLYLRGVSEEDLRRSAVSKGWILFVASNGNVDRIGDSVLVDCDMRMVFASFLMGMTPKDPSQLRPEFLALWLKIHNVHEAFSKTSQHTSGLGNFSWSAVKRLPVRFPKNSGEQIAITRLMSLVDRYIAMTSARGLFLRDISAPMKATENDENSDPDSGLADEATETEDIERVEALPHDAELERFS